tara:strand:- start:271 stop:585 length:315 start_codon:yes stop_codon:yes gene_type:complete
MRRLLILSLVFFSILFTSLVKNSTKKIDDKIFNVKENLRDLKAKSEEVRLEFNYLGSAEKLFEYQNQYFANELSKKNITEIKTLNFMNKDLLIDNLKINQKNEN